MNSARLLLGVLLSTLMACGGSAAVAPSPVRPASTVTGAAAATDAKPPARPTDPVAIAEAHVATSKELAEQWDFAAAILELEPAMATYDAELPDTDPRVREVMHLLGQAYRRAQRWDDAVRLDERRLVLVRRLGLRAEESNTLNELGLTAKESGQPDVAVGYFHLCLAIDDDLGLAEDNPEHQTHLHNLGLTYGDAGDHERAAEMLERVLAVDRRDDPMSINTANTMHNLALEYRDLGDLERARPMFESAIRIITAKRGATHPHLFPLMNGLAGTLWMMGNAGEAEIVYTQVIALTEKHPRHESRALALSEVGIMELDRGDIPQARKHLDESLAITRAIWPADHRELVRPLAKHVRALLASQEYDAAWRESVEAATISAIELSEWDRSNIKDLRGLWLDVGRAEEAKKLLAWLPAQDAKLAKKQSKSRTKAKKTRPKKGK